MSPLRPIHLLSIFLSLLTIVVIATPVTEQLTELDNEKFHRLLDNVDDSAIHSVLHVWSNKFQDGVFPKDRTAIEAVHSENADLATKLVKLAKKAVSNSTTVAPVVTTSSTRHTTTVEPVQTTPTTTDSLFSTNSDIRTSVVAPSRPTDASAVSTQSDGAVVVSRTGSAGSSGALETLSSSTALVSYGASTQTLLTTTTLPDGQPSTLTSVAVVEAALTTLTTATAVAGQSAAASSTPSPSLQTGGATNIKGYRETALAFVLTGVIAVIMVL